MRSKEKRVIKTNRHTDRRDRGRERKANRGVAERKETRGKGDGEKAKDKK